MEVGKNNNDKNGAEPLRTYSSDLAEAVRKDEMTVIKAAMEEEKRRQQEETMYAAGSPRNRRFIIIGISLILATTIGLGALYLIKNYKGPVTLQSQARIPTLISAEQSTSIEIGGASQDKVIEYTRTAINNIAVPDGQIMNLYYTDATSGTKKIIGTGDFLLAIKSQIPSALFNTLDNTFMLGLYASGGERHPFIVLQTSNFQVAFPSMFDWEY